VRSGKVTDVDHLAKVVEHRKGAVEEKMSA
jgi:hypothetical protein